MKKKPESHLVPALLVPSSILTEPESHLVPALLVPSSILTEHAGFACAASHLSKTLSVDGKTTFWSCPVCGFATGGGAPTPRPKLTKIEREKLQPTLAGLDQKFMERRSRARR